MGTTREFRKTLSKTLVLKVGDMMMNKKRRIKGVLRDGKILDGIYFGAIITWK